MLYLRRLAILFCLGACALAPAASFAAGELAPTASASASASGAAGAGSPLPDLPRLAPLTFPEPDPGALQELNKLLDRLTADDDRTRANARPAVDEVDSASWIAAIRHHVQEIRTSLDRESAPKMLEDARKAGRKSLRSKGGDAKSGKSDGKSSDSKGKSSKDSAKASDKGKTSKDNAKPSEPSKPSKSAETDDAGEGDWLDFMLAAPHPKDKTWRSLVELLAMERMLTAIGTTPAVRELIALHAYFGDMLRIDLQRQVAKLRDKAVPALIEARQHDAKIVQRWANKQLDLLGRAIPGETVASNDTQILADVLRAYGRTRDVDAVRVILSFCNSDRIQLREASREAIAAIGEPGIWQLRDVYLNLTGSKPPREWTWDRIARELFATYDRARLEEVYKLMDEGVASASAGKLDEATAAFDKVLARSPLFERRKEMVKTYVDRAMQLESDKREDALAMLRKALRLDPKAEGSKKIEAEIAYLEGVILIEQGSPDRFLLTKALELDPSHERAKQALASLEQKVVERKSNLTRYVAAGGVGLAALVAMILLARRRRPPGGSVPPPAPPPGGSPEPAPSPPS